MVTTAGAGSAGPIIPRFFAWLGSGVIRVVQALMNGWRLILGLFFLALIVGLGIANWTMIASWVTPGAAKAANQQAASATVSDRSEEILKGITTLQSGQTKQETSLNNLQSSLDSQGKRLSGLEDRTTKLESKFAAMKDGGTIGGDGGNGGTTGNGTATCKAGLDYQLFELDEISVEPKGWLHVQYYLPGEPEFESVFPSGRYSLENHNLKGHVWEYPQSCSLDQVLEQVTGSASFPGSIERRLQVVVNTRGYKHFQSIIDAGLFKVIKRTDEGAKVPETITIVWKDSSLQSKLPGSSSSSSPNATAIPTATSSSNPAPTATAQPNSNPVPTATSVPVAQTTCGQATRGKDFGVKEKIGPFDAPAAVSPWWDPKSSAPDSKGQITVILDKGQSLDGNWNGGAVWLYGGCSVDQVRKDVLASSSHFPLYKWNGSAWVKDE